MDMLKKFVCEYAPVMHLIDSEVHAMQWLDANETWKLLTDKQKNIFSTC